MRKLVRKITCYILICITVICSANAQNIHDTLSHISRLNAQGMGHYMDFLKYRDQNRETAIKHALEFTRDLDTNSTDIYIADLYKYISEYYENNCYDYAEALKYRKKIEPIYQASGLAADICRNQVAQARLYIKMGKAYESFNTIQDAMPMAEKLKDTISIRECCMALEGISLVYRDNPSQARYYNQIVSSTSKTPEEDFQRCQALKSQFHYPLNGDRVDSLIRVTDSLCHLNGFSSIELCMNLNASIYFSDNQETEKARVYLEKALNTAGERDFRDSGYVKIAQSTYKLNTGDTCGAVKDIEQAISLLERGDFKEHLEHCYLKLHDLYTLQEDYQNAYSALRSYNDIIFSRNNPAIIRDLSKSLTQMEITKARTEFNREKKEHQYVIAILGLSIIILLLVFKVYLNKRKYELKKAQLEKEKTEQQLTDQENILEVKRVKEYQESIFVEGLIKELMNLTSRENISDIKSSIYNIIHQLKGSKDTSSWQEIEKSLINKNSNFYTNLIERHPDLTPNERRLCSFLHMNMSTKDISHITGQNARTINTARTRLRKKLNLTGDDKSISAYLDEFI